MGSDLPCTKISSSRLARAITVGGTTLSESKAASAAPELAFAAVDQPDVRKRLIALLKALDPPQDDLANRREIVDPFDALDLVLAIARLERQAVDEPHQRADHLVAAQVRDIHAVDRARNGVELQDLLQSLQPFSRVDVKHLGLRVLGEVAPQAEVFERFDLVAQPGGLFEEELLAGLAHLVVHFLEQSVLLAVQKHLEAADARPVGFAIDSEVARGRALADRGQQAGPEPAPARVVFLDIQRAGAKLEDSLEDLNGACAGFWPAETARRA